MTLGVLAVWTDVTEAAEADFDLWYDRQHLPERTTIPGFVNGRRYEALDGAPKYFAWYETDAPDVLASPAYAARHADPTAWTRRVMPAFRGTIRVATRVVAGFGQGLGSHVATWRFRPASGADARIGAMVSDRLFATLERRPGIVSGRLLAPVAADAGLDSPEARMRPEPESAPVWSIIVETTRPDAIEAVQGMLPAGSLAVAGAVASSVAFGSYRLLSAVGRFPFETRPDLLP